MNKIIVIGRLTRDPEMSYTPKGTPIAKLSVAVDRRFKDQNGQKVTDFFDVDVWGKLAEIVGNYMTKGRQICVEGEMRRDTWTDKEGQKRVTWRVHAENVEFLGSKNDAPGGGGGGGGARRAPSTNAADDDITFNDVDESSLDEELERNQPYGF